MWRAPCYGCPSSARTLCLLVIPAGPSLVDGSDHFTTCCRRMRCSVGSGVIQVNSDFGAGEFPLLRAAAELARRPLSLLLVQMDSAPNRWAETLTSLDAACADGLDFTAQVGSRPIGILLGLQASRHPFLTHPLWHSLDALDHNAKTARIISDRDLRRRLIEDRPDDDYTRGMATILERTFELGEPLN